MHNFIDKTQDVFKASCVFVFADINQMNEKPSFL